MMTPKNVTVPNTNNTKPTTSMRRRDYLIGSEPTQAST
jgi:hypothetical protein